MEYFYRYPPNADRVFEMFGWLHGLVFLIFVILFILISKYSHKVTNQKIDLAIRVIVAIYLVFTGIHLMYYVYKYNFEWYDYLPHATCGFAVYFGAYTLITKNRPMFVMTFFYGFGALLTMLIPDLHEGPDNYYFYQFLLRHMLIIYVPIYMMKRHGFKIYKSDYKLFLVVTLSLVFIGLVLGEYVGKPKLFNMMYIMAPPVPGTYLDTIYEYSVNLYRIVWLIIAAGLAFLYGLPFYEKEKDI